LKPSIIILEEKWKEVFCEMSSKSPHFEQVEKDQFQCWNSDWIVCNLNLWAWLEWDQTSSFILLLLEMFTIDTFLW